MFLPNQAHEIVESLKSIDDIAIIGIKNRGSYLGERLAAKISKITGKAPLVGALDITLYRDDLTQVAEQPVVHATEIDFAIDGKRVVLVDDVLFTRRHGGEPRAGGRLVLANRLFFIY